jgi:threonine dehydrogenase-like Zn-dependent dehydrogenase
VLIIGPGQQGAACTIACEEAGAALVVVAGLARDARRLDIARQVGATDTVVSQERDPVEVIRDLTAGEMADVVIDVSGGGAVTLMTALRAVRTGGTIVIASGGPKCGPGWDELDLALIRKKRVTLRGVRGHSFAAVERALQVIGRGGTRLGLLAGAPLSLDRMADALDAVAGTVDAETLHVSVDPWL